MTLTTDRIDFTDVDVFRLDPYFRDEHGKFTRKPDRLPGPVRNLPTPTVTQLASYSGVAWSVPDGSYVTSWRVRCVKQDDGKWRVIYEDESEFPA